MDLRAVDLGRSAFGATGLSPATYRGGEEGRKDPVDTVVSMPAERTRAARSASPEVRVRYNPQDGMAMEPGETRVPRADIGTDLSNPRIRMDDGTPERPDADGNYLFAPGTRGYQQADSFVSTQRALRLFEKALGHDIPWAFRGKLEIHPHAGSDFNAYYSRGDASINFYDGWDPIARRTIHASESLDVVSHETGHAILDGMKPGLLGWFGGVECEAFHETFGDVAAMLTAMQDERVIDHLVQQTGGDLHADNVVAHLAEELSQGINNAIFNGGKPQGWTIRNANNALRYQNPKTLPSNPSDETQLGKEPHNFSRLFTGATWDIMAGIASSEMAAGKSPGQALGAARDVMLPLFARMVELGPNRMKTYRQMADAMLEADRRDFKGKNADLIKRVFADRAIRPATAAEPRVPSIMLEQPIRSDSDAVDFLADHRHLLGVPGDVPLRPAARWSNDRGETFVRYDYARDVRVEKNLSTELLGSLTVAFDRDGKLFHSLWEPIDPEHIDLALDAIALHQAEGDIRQPGDILKSVKPDGHPWAGYIAVTAEGDRKLIRLPATT